MQECIICNNKITDEEFQFEDYYTVTRGHNNYEAEGYACFACVKETYKPNTN